MGISTIVCHGYNVTCSESNQCRNTIINCLPHQDCYIFCSATHPCLQSTVHCPVIGICQIDCNGIDSCVNTIFNGSQSIQLGIAGCTESNSCSDVSIYCPLNSTRHSKPCWISGDWTCINDDCNHKYIPRAPSDTKQTNNSLMYMMLSSVAAFFLIIGCFVICRKLTIRYKWNKNNTIDDKISHSLHFDDDMNVVNDAQIIHTPSEQRPPQTSVDIIDPLDPSTNFVLPQPSASTFLSGPISELHSPNAMPLRNRLSSEFSLEINNFSMPSFDAKWEGNLSPIFSQNAVVQMEDDESVEEVDMSVNDFSEIQSVKNPNQAL